MTWLLIGIGAWALVVLFVLTLLLARRSHEDPHPEREPEREHDEERRVAERREHVLSSTAMWPPGR